VSSVATVVLAARGWSGVASPEALALQATGHDQSNQHHHHAGNEAPVAPGCIHADSPAIRAILLRIIYPGSFVAACIRPG
jgi:hypothetical protein